MMIDDADNDYHDDYFLYVDHDSDNYEHDDIDDID